MRQHDGVGLAVTYVELSPDLVSDSGVYSFCCRACQAAEARDEGCDLDTQQIVHLVAPAFVDSLREQADATEREGCAYRVSRGVAEGLNRDTHLRKDRAPLDRIRGGREGLAVHQDQPRAHRP